MITKRRKSHASNGSRPDSDGRISSIHPGMIQRPSATAVLASIRSTKSQSLSDNHIAQPIHIIGAGQAGITLAVELCDMGATLGMPVQPIVYGRRLFGDVSDPIIAALRCQGWTHSGALYAMSQPVTALSLWISALPRLKALAAPAIREGLPSLMLEPENLRQQQPQLVDALDAAGIPYKQVSARIVRQLLPSIPRRLMSYTSAFLTPDTTVDLPLLQCCLHRCAVKGGTRFIDAHVKEVNATAEGRAISQLILEDGRQVIVKPSDAVVFCCGAQINRMLRQLGVEPMLRLFKSYLVATDFDLSALVAVVGGGVNAVPHPQADGRTIAVFGNSRRIELPTSSDVRSVAGGSTGEDECVRSVCEDVNRFFGIQLRRDRILTWPGIKTEHVIEGVRNQGYYAARVAGLQNAWQLIPGKLTGAPAAAHELARRLFSARLGDSVGRSIWEISSLPSEVGVLASASSAHPCLET